MKIGVVCEGLTDYFAIKYYVGEALLAKGLEVTFVAVQPAADNTSGGGWPNVISWLENNTPEKRKPFFEAGLFAHSTKLAGLDYLLFHMDTDVLGEVSFQNFVDKNGLALQEVADVEAKSLEVSKVLLHFIRIGEMNDEMQKRHIPAPIAESSEAWCIAADSSYQGNAEALIGQDLVDAFGAALARFNKQQVKQTYSKINKKQKSRERYCDGTRGNHGHLNSCILFFNLVESLHAVHTA